MTSTTVHSLADRLCEAIGRVPDPELGGVTLAELGMIHRIFLTDLDPPRATAQLIPTFLGCPALSIIAQDVEQAGQRLGVNVTVVFPPDAPPWTTERVSTHGRDRLNELGIAVATHDEPQPNCPRCRRNTLARRIPVGSTSCRASAWCTSCRDVVDILRGADR